MKIILAVLLACWAGFASAGEVRVSAGQEIIHETDGQVYSVQVEVPKYADVFAGVDVIDDNTFMTASYRFHWGPLFVMVGGGYAFHRTASIADSFVARAEVGVRLTEHIELSIPHWSTPGQRDRGDNAVMIGTRVRF